jgi:WD40 repeat protein
MMNRNYFFLALWMLIRISPISGAQNFTLTSHSSFVGGLAFSSDHSFLASCSADTYVNIWNSTTSWSLQNRLVGGGRCDALIQLPNAQLATTSNNKINIWSIFNKTTGPITTITAHSNDVYSLALSPDGLILASGSADNTTRLWNYSNPSPYLKTLCCHSNQVRALCFASDQIIASGSLDKTIKIWNVSSGKSSFYFFFQKRKSTVKRAAHII